jgi:cytochrome P450
MQGKEVEENKSHDNLPRTIFYELLQSDLPPEEKNFEHLWKEGQNLVGAGGETVANALSFTTFHLLNNPDKLKKLKDELEKAMPNKYEQWDLPAAEKLPYLSAVVNEGLR